ncbi:MAG: hypothetical protein CL609_12200 [Anaerolineaceae bacterium]|nr:hypothetical protein [Anaerolineaceae bacterium]
MKKINFDSRRLIVYAVLLVLFFLLMGLSTKFSDLNQLNEQNELMNTEVVALRATNYVLETQIAFATSEAAVEAYAREDGYMVRPGEVLIVPISPKHVTPSPEIVPTATIEPLSNLEIWFQLFFSNGNP